MYLFSGYMKMRCMFEANAMVSSLDNTLLHAQHTGISGVPNFEVYLSDKPTMRQQFSGAQPTETFIAIFKRLLTLAKM